MPKATSYPSSKLKQWEKDRRERLNICFRDLASLLPSHDPAVTLSKVQILQKAAKYIRELQGENRVLVEDSASEVSVKQLQVLRQRSDDLLRRVQQLVELLQDAGIAVPSAVSVKSEPLKEKQLKWDSKIKPENAKILEEKAKDKKLENRKKVQKWKKRSFCDNPGVQTKCLKSKGSAQKSSKTGSSSNTSSCPSKTDRPQEQRQPLREQGNSSLRNKNCQLVLVQKNNGSVVCTTSPASVQASVGVCAPQYPSTSSSTCFVEPGVLRATNAGSGKNMVVSVTNSHLLTAPVVSPSVQTHPPSSVVTSSGLVPGTIIFASGSIVPVLPASQTVITAPAQYIMNASHHVPMLHKPPVVVVQKNAPPSLHMSTDKRGKTFPLLIPKRKTDTGKAKFPNKVAISASASRYLPLQVQSEKTNFLVVKEATNKRTLNTSHQINADRTTSHKEKFTGSMKRRKVVVAPKAVDKQDKVTKRNIISNIVLNQVSDTSKSAENSTKTKSADMISTAAGEPTELDGNLKVDAVTTPIIPDTDIMENSKENCEESKVLMYVTQKAHVERTKKRINSEVKVNDLKVENKKLKFSQKCDASMESCEIRNGKSTQCVSISDLDSVVADCVNISTYEASNVELPSAVLQQIGSNSVAISDKVNNMFQSDSNIAVSENLQHDSRQQEDCTRDSIFIPPDGVRDRDTASVTTENIDNSDVAPQTVANSVHDNSTNCIINANTIPVASSSICASKNDYVTSDGASKASETPMDTEGHVKRDTLSSATHDDTNIELQEKACITSVANTNSKKTDLLLECSLSKEGGQNSGGEDSKILEASISVCERDLNSKQQKHVDANDKSSTTDAHFPEDSYNTEKFSLPVQAFGAFDQVNLVKDDECKMSTSSVPVLFDSVLGQELHSTAQNIGNKSAVSAGPVVNISPSEVLQNKTCIDGASKKNTFGIYTIDSLCKTSVSGGMDMDLLEKDMPESAPLSFNMEGTCTSSLHGNKSVANTDAKFMRMAKSVIANEQDSVGRNGVQTCSYDSNALGKLNANGLESKNKKCLKDLNTVSSNATNTTTISQKSLSHVNESLPLKVVLSDKGASKYSTCEVNLHSPSSCATGNKHSPQSDEASTCRSDGDQCDIFVGKQRLDSDNSKVSERISACIGEVCTSENSAEVSMSSSNLASSVTVETYSVNTTQTCTMRAVEITFPGREISVISTAGESMGDYNKQDAVSQSIQYTSQSADGSFPVGTKCLPTATNLHTLPSDASVYTSHDDVPKVCDIPSSYPSKLDESRMPPSCYRACVSNSTAKPDSNKPRDELMCEDINVPVCNALHSSTTTSYAKDKSAVEHIDFSLMSVTHAHSEMQPPVTCASCNLGNTTCTSSLCNSVHNSSNSVCNFTSGINTHSLPGSHLTFSTTDVRCSSTSQHNDLSVSVPTTFTPGVHTLTQIHLTSNDKGTLSLQQKCSTAASTAYSFTPIYTFCQKQPDMPYSSSNSCNLASLNKQELAVSQLPSFTSVHTHAETQPQVTYSTSNDKCSSLPQPHIGYNVSNEKCYSLLPSKNESLVLAPNSSTPVHVFSQTQPRDTYSSSDKCNSSSQQECLVSVPNSFTWSHSFSHTQPHLTYSSSDTCNSLFKQKQESGCSIPNSVMSVHVFSQTQAQMPCSANSDKSPLQHKRESTVVSMPPSFTPVHTYSLTQPHVTFSNSDKCVQQKYESAVPAPSSLTPIHTFPQTKSHITYLNNDKFNMPLQQKHRSTVLASSNSLTPVHTFPQTQPHPTFSSTKNTCNLSLSNKPESAVSVSNSFVPIHTFSHTQPSITYSSSDKCSLSIQQKHESTVSTATFMSVGSTVPTKAQASVVSSSSSLTFPEREFSASTFTPVSQIMSDIRTHVSVYPNLNCSAASHSWLPTSGTDKSWFSMSKPLNSVPTAHRKTSGGDEGISSSANLSLQTNEFPSDIFASLQVPSGGQHPESISPTAAFLLAFPLVSSSKVSDMIDPQDVDCDSLHGASSLLQIGNIDHYSTTKKDMSSTSSTLQQTNVQPSVQKCPLSGKGRTGVNVTETGEKSLTNKDFYHSNQLSFVHAHKENTDSKTGINIKSTEISTSTSNNVIEECVKHNIANRSVGTQFKSTDMCDAKSLVANAVSKPYVPTTFHESYTSAGVSVANTVSVTINHTANMSTANSLTGRKIHESGVYPSFSSAGVSYEASASSLSSQLFHTQEKSKKNSEDMHFPIISKGQSFSGSHENPELKWSHEKNDNFEKQNATGSFTARKSNNFSNKDRMLQLHSSNRSAGNADLVDLDLYKASLSSRNPGASKFESSQTCSTTMSRTGTSLASNPSYNHNLSQGNEHGVISSHSTSLPTYNGSQTTGTSSSCTVPSCASFSILPWTTSVTNIGHSSVLSTAQNVAMGVSHQCPATQYTLPRAATSNADCTNNHYGADPSYLLPSNKHTAATGDRQEAVGSNIKSVDGLSSKLGDPSSNKFVKRCEQKILGSAHQLPVGDGMGLFSSGSVTTAINSETVDTFKFAFPSDHHQAYQQHAHRPPVNWMTTPAVTTNQSKQTFSTYFSAPSTMDVPNSSQLDNQQLRNSSYFTVANLDTTVFTPSTSSCYSNKTQTQNPLCQVRTSSEKQQNTSASVPFTNETQNDSGRLAIQNNSTQISQIQQNEFYAAPWTQIKPPFPTDALSSDVNNLFVPSTLPTLVGDLALGTGCIMNTVEENNANKPFSNSEYNDIGQHTKEQKLDMSGRQIKNRQVTKDTGRKSKHNMDCTHNFDNVSQVVPNSVGSSFLSVSQLVDPMKSATDTSGCHAALRGYGINSSSQAVMSGKQLRHQNASLCAKRETHPQSTLDNKDDGKKVERLHNMANNMTYHIEEMSQAIPSEQAKQENSKNNEISARNTVEYQSTVAESFQWLPPDTSSRKQTRPSGSSYKTQLSTYSAEALIGINQNATVNGNMTHNASHKVISLPPPVVSDRFDNQNNYTVGPHAPRKIPYSDSTLLSGTYNIRPLDLPMSQDFTIQPSSVANHQMCGGSTPRYSTASTLEPPIHRRENGGVCRAPYFTSGVNSVAQGFVPDLGGSSCGLVAPDGKIPVSFPTFTFSKEPCPPKNEKQNLMYSQQASSSSSIGQHVGVAHSKIETSVGASSNDHTGEKTTNNHNNTNNNRQSGSGVTLQLQNIAGSGSSNCLLGKQRGRKRVPDATSVSSIGNLVDLGYLTMPPGIGSPMLGDDGMYFSHTTNFHSGPPALYPGGPPNAQGSFYTPPRAPFPSCNTAAPRTLQLATASPNATNTSGTTLANFNLSTIFPEIVDKQASSVSATEFPPAKPADGNSQHSQRPLMGMCAGSAPGYTHAPPSKLNTFAHANPSGTRTQWL